ncbi:MAG: Asp-tRNA(Asn)/Glu-tRNA(Gln) amidotransferase subunit GatC [Candidatus Moranbacteria bacterium]|nr:Asp-tRNA(Asn)/Glu-tRNA(Gln) amidotransferase subunit GatC [Candidatus Moranbacteria bacterium]
MLTKDEIKHVAVLARIGVSDEDIERYQKDLSSILDYFKELEGINTDSVEEIGHITGRFNAMRGDNVSDSTEKEKEDILKNAPKERDGQFQVKSVF